MLNKYLVLAFIAILTGVITILFSRVIAAVVFAICFLLYMLLLGKNHPEKLNTEIKELAAWKVRTAKSMMIWFPFFVIAILIYSQYWSDNLVMIFVLGVGSWVVAFFVEKLFWADK